MTPEERLRAALDDRAAVSRTSPDALDGVFGKVARRRRAVRAAAVAGLAVSVLTAVVATAALRPVAERTSPTDTLPTAAPTTPPSPEATPSTAGLSDADDLALVSLPDGRVVELSTTTGEVLREITKFSGGGPTALAWSQDRRTLLTVLGPCTMMLLDRESGPKADVGNGRAPALSPDGSRIAFAPCEDDGKVGLTVYEKATGSLTTYPAPRTTPSGDQTDDYGHGPVVALTWWDSDTLVVVQSYEGGLPPRLLDVDTAKDLGQATRLGPNAADRVAGDEKTLVGTTECCMPDWDQPAAVWELRDGKAVTLFEHPAGVTSIAVDRRGAVLVVDKAGLWRWDRRSEPKLIAPGALAVAA